MHPQAPTCRQSFGDTGSVEPVSESRRRRQPVLLTKGKSVSTIGRAADGIESHSSVRGSPRSTADRSSEIVAYLLGPEMCNRCSMSFELSECRCCRLFFQHGCFPETRAVHSVPPLAVLEQVFGQPWELLSRVAATRERAVGRQVLHHRQGLSERPLG